MEIERHFIECAKDKLAARIHYGDANAAAPLPAVLMCHGFFCIQDVLLAGFVQRFVDAGYRVVTFDYRGFGDSEGDAGRIVPERQIEDILAVLDWCKTQSRIDARRIALWGTSLGGGHVIEVAARRPEVKCVLSQLAFADGEQLVTGDMGLEEKARFMDTMARMANKKQQDGKELLVPIIKVMTDEESRTFFEKKKKDFPALDIKIPYLTVWETILYHPVRAAARVTQPTFMVFAENDKVIALEYGLALYQAIGAEKSCHIQPKARHYQVFAGEHLNQIAARQLAWLRKYL
ncbi:alpha/beta hydrolase [Acerihabitans arboris]|uniref:Alpha/beta fold hydrolase n=1 Tax=Acerihabitans arboris TaxID=2691583 RepID=A0A845SR94_9GAMM|nr:alpha/beta fold hydrolase [Acerihabitans arboris]NDL63655.1 alpha/beta fold hydrolase [Acerihabitans arboris]